ncbi:hypothetical protein HanIR_Chr16g0790441 [Helianthus annuus]|nr:hypothetical protein HanIR_Chr16g0790441 [Helianthus annuus]
MLNDKLPLLINSLYNFCLVLLLTWLNPSSSSSVGPSHLHHLHHKPTPHLCLSFFSGDGDQKRRERREMTRERRDRRRWWNGGSAVAHGGGSGGTGVGDSIVDQPSLPIIPTIDLHLRVTPTISD